MHFSTPLCMALALPILASAFGDQDDAIHVALMARQEPGTPKYVCHENCGTLVPSYVFPFMRPIIEILTCYLYSLSRHCPFYFKERWLLQQR